MPKTKEKKEKDKDGERRSSRSSGVAGQVGSFFKAATRKSGSGRNSGTGEGVGLDPTDINVEEQDFDTVKSINSVKSVNSTDSVAIPSGRSGRSSSKQEDVPSRSHSKRSSSTDSARSVTSLNSGRSSQRDPGSPQHAPSSPTSPMPPVPMVDPTTSSVYSAARRSSRNSGSSKAHLYSLQSIEDFLASGLLPVHGQYGDSSGRIGLLEVQHSESIASVVEKLYQWRLRSCIVSFNLSKKEFFDCMDLMCFILKEVNDNDGSDYDDWEVMKSTLRRVADSPVSQAVRPPRGCCEYHRVDSEESLITLLGLLRDYRRVPVYRKGELCRIVTASDILEMCCCASEDTKGLLEKTKLIDVMNKSPGFLSKLSVAEDFSLLEVLQSLQNTNTQVVPVVEGVQRIHSFDTGGSTSSNLSYMVAAKSEALQKDITTGSGRSLVGQFDVASLRVMLLKHHEAQDGMWWWEDASLNTKNIMLEPCMDFLALSGSVIVSHSVSAPYNAVPAEETLARAIGRVLASAYQSVVVYPPGARTGEDGNLSARAKAIAGIASTQSLVISMLEGGLFQSLKFDPAKPRRVDSEDTPPSARQNVRSSRSSRRPPTLTNIQVLGALVPDQPSYRDPKVKFNNIIDLDYLGVPTCPDHGVRFMQFVQDENTMFPLDFHALMDLPDHTKVAGATAQCLSCQRLLGRVSTRPKPQGEMLRPSTPPSGGLFGLGEMASSFGNVFPEMPFLKRNGGATSPTNIRSGASSPSNSALKAGTNYPLKKSKTAERLEALRAQEEARTGGASPEKTSRGGFLFSRCCSPCRCLSDKEQIASNVSVVRGSLPLNEFDSPPPRSNSRTESPPSAVSRSSGRNSPSGSSTPLLAPANGNGQASGSSSQRSERRSTNSKDKKR